MAAILGLSSVVNADFLKKFSALNSGSSASTALSNALHGTSSTVDLSTSLRTGAQLFAGAVQYLNSTITFIGASQDAMKKLKSIVDEAVTITEHATKNSGSIVNASVNVEFSQLASEFRDVVSSAKIGNYDLLSYQGISDAFKLVGLDKEQSDSIAAIFAKFLLSGTGGLPTDSSLGSTTSTSTDTTVSSDQYIADEQIKARRPVYVPHSAYQRYVISQSVSGNGDGTFQAQACYSVGTGGAVITGDYINSDQRADIISANTNDNTISLLLANGDGSFKAQTCFQVGVVPSAITTGDLAGTGHASVVTANNTSNNISVLLGNGDGTFQSQVCYTAGDGASGVTNADLNSDGYLDLIVTNNRSNNVSVLMGNGNGTFSAQVCYAVGAGAAGLVVKDINSDGNKDIVTVNSSDDSVSVLFGVGNGTFGVATSYQAGVTPTSIVAEDFNGDGKQDLAVTDLGGLFGGTVSVLLNQGAGTFAASISYTAGSTPTGLASLDVNGDGKKDLLFANQSTNKASVMYGVGDGTFQAPVSFVTGIGPQSVLVRDMNRDGIPDVVTGNATSGNVSVLLGNGTSTTTASVTTAVISGASIEYPSIFDSSRVIKTKVDAYRVLADLKELQTQLNKNLDALDYASKIVEDNLSLVRASGFALLNVSNQLKGNEDAETVAAQVRQQMLSSSPSILAQLQNLNPIIVATLTLTSSTNASTPYSAG